jgi:hypothetical protein
LVIGKLVAGQSSRTSATKRAGRAWGFSAVISVICVRIQEVKEKVIGHWEKHQLQPKTNEGEVALNRSTPKKIANIQ